MEKIIITIIYAILTVNLLVFVIKEVIKTYRAAKSDVYGGDAIEK